MAPKAVATTICTSAPGKAIRPDRQQIIQGKMEPDPEHQQNDANFRQLPGQFHIRHKARRIGSENYPCCQIPDQYRQFQPVGNQPHKQCETETDGNGSDQGKTMGHVSWQKITAREENQPPAGMCNARQGSIAAQDL